MRYLMALCVTSCLVPPTLADDTDALASIKKGTAATALVVLPAEGGLGSAFCIEPTGYFVTNEHVVRGLIAGKKLSLVLHPGEDNERMVEASVLRTDANSDLALLGIVEPKELAWLDLGGINDLTETMQVTAFGYPFGDRLAVRERKYPSVSVNVGMCRIGFLRLRCVAFARCVGWVCLGCLIW